MQPVDAAAAASTGFEVSAATRVAKAEFLRRPSCLIKPVLEGRDRELERASQLWLGREQASEH